jgi:mono/diheme cytochrome c family protein
MKTAGFLALLLFPAFISVAQTRPEPASSDSVARGKYIVDRVAMCVECHTPRNEQGQRLETEYLDGAPIPVSAPPFPNMRWAIKAPAIAGFIGYSKEQGIRLLTQGITSDGRIPNPPMPAFRLTRSDAEAVVDYLKSLK